MVCNHKPAGGADEAATGTDHGRAGVLEMTPDRTDLSVNGWNAEYVDGLYQQWQADPDSVEPEWRQFFAGFDLGYRPTPGCESPRALPAAPTTTGGAATKQRKVTPLI